MVPYFFVVLFWTIINSIDKKGVFFKKEAVDVVSELSGLRISFMVVEVSAIQFMNIDLHIFISFTGPNGLLEEEFFDSHFFVNLHEGGCTILLKYLNYLNVFLTC